MNCGSEMGSDCVELRRSGVCQKLRGGPDSIGPGNSSALAGKDPWPELVGAKGMAAEAKIESEHDFVEAVIVEEGSFVTHEKAVNHEKLES
ncbi:hypothetical protein M0R45_018329 [Rubus argutus]|uniref:Uncharacterized protein n=1 Tax=Rubus argutus TaxID=59490 RepID=A0AAW1X4R2_RUBAR